MMSSAEIKQMAIEAIKAKYKDLEEAFPTKEEFDKWINDQINALVDNMTNKITSFMTKMESFQSELSGMTSSVVVFSASGPTYLASAAAAAALGDSNATARAMAEYNTTAAQLSSSVKECIIKKTELNDEAEGLMIKSLPGFSTLWNTFIGVVDAYTSACSAIRPISG